MEKSEVLKNIFSVRNSSTKTHKIVKICGLKLKFRRDGNRKAYKRLVNGIRKNSVLIVETNNCHYEVIPGYAKYFCELGYNVDVAVYEGDQLDFLAEAVRSVRIFSLGEKDMERLLGSEEIDGYHYILFSSAIKYVPGIAANSSEMPLVTDYYKDLKVATNKLIFVQHHLERQGVNRNQIALADLHNQYSEKFFVVNPHYFGKMKITPKNKDVTKFIVVGSISLWRKNYQLLADTVRELAGCEKPFKVIVVGAGDELKQDKVIAPFMDIRGRLSYRDMFAAMEEADFFLCLLDYENPDHKRYITSGTSGSFQLIYGFAKPCLIQKNFADVYGFDQSNSLVYEKNVDLKATMLQAMEMSGDEYERIQTGLKDKAEVIRRLSLENLKNILQLIDEKQ